MRKDRLSIAQIRLKISSLNDRINELTWKKEVMKDRLRNKDPEVLLRDEFRELDEEMISLEMDIENTIEHVSHRIEYCIEDIKPLPNLIKKAILMQKKIDKVKILLKNFDVKGDKNGSKMVL